MFYKTNLSNAQRKIILDLCDTQIESIIRIKSRGEDIEDILSDIGQFGINSEDIHEECDEFLEQLERIKANPNEFFSCNPILQSTLRSILSKIEDRYKGKYPNALASVWRKLFLILDMEESGMNFN